MTIEQRLNGIAGKFTRYDLMLFSPEERTYYDEHNINKFIDDRYDRAMREWNAKFKQHERDQRS